MTLHDRQSSFGWLSSRPPTCAVEVAARRVSAVAIADQRGSRVITGHATEPLAAGVVDPAINAVNVHDPGALSGAITAVLDRLTPRPRRVALVLPDTVGKVSLIKFDTVPPKAADFEQLLRWQVRKAAPFKIEDAQLAWAPGVMHPGGGREFIVTMARRDIVQSYERVCEAAGAYAGIVDLASLNLVNAVIAADAGRPPAGDPSTGSGRDWLLVHVAADYGTLAVVRGADLIFFRHRGTDGNDDLAELVHQTAMYHEDRLGGGGFSRVVLAGASSRGPEFAERLRRSLEERVGARVEPMDFRSAVALRDRISAGPELLDTLAPSLGLLLRERVA
jgi:Tfp pilus assembly PilM family ATPase